MTIDGTQIDVYFSPDDGVQASFLGLLENAQESIYFMAFSFTADSMGEAIRNRAREDVVVAGVMDDEQVNSNVGTEFDPFRQAGLDVLRDANEGQMHHKVMIIDESIVVFGSYNFTNSAETRNDENLIVIYNEEIAAQFMAEFNRVHSQAQAAKCSNFASSVFSLKDFCFTRNFLGRFSTNRMKSVHKIQKKR